MNSLSRVTFQSLLGLILLSQPFMVATNQADEWRGNIALESRIYFEDGIAGQDSEQYSLRFEPEYNHSFEGSSSAFSFQALFREDSMDEQRSHSDLRELSWLSYGDGWEFKIGVSKVFWGVAESQHLVDIINQTDGVENADGEDKLGQPMANLTLLQEWGTLDFFILPWFRERTFAGVDGRFRAPIEVDTDNPIFESPNENQNLDAAIRWSHTFDEWDVGVAHFSGTSREPRLVPAITEDGLVLQPMYNLIDQTSLDVQATLDIWLWKLEVISNRGFDTERYTAAVGGFEYSFYDLAESGIDLGVIVEYQFDERDIDIMGSPVQDKLVLGGRFAFNDEQSTEILLGVSINETAHNYLWNLEASRRISDSWKLIVEARIISNIDESQPASSPYYSIRDDSFVMIELARYF
ncbi:MAG: hypothetical protein DRQ47_03265 [Gammaproteobacteria bacterium]|nr:MAG: hypothetical protein DRQ47_03265 [Gammaproteobacteria bacterium]